MAKFTAKYKAGENETALRKTFLISPKVKKSVVVTTPTKVEARIFKTNTVIAIFLLLHLVLTSSLAFSFESDMLARCERTRYIPHSLSTCVHSCSSKLAHSESVPM